jgi:hypothetical protein
MTDKEAMKLALFALDIVKIHYTQNRHINEAITALKERLADPIREVQRLGQEIEQDADSFCDSNCVWTDHHPDCKLAQPEQEPVKWSEYEPDGMHHNKPQKRPQNCGTGYCSCIECVMEPPQRTWVDVPDEEIKILWIQYRAALPRYLCFSKALLARARGQA